MPRTRAAAGIYTLMHLVSGRVYVGQARNIRKRWEIHRWGLGAGKHRNSHLQRAWDKYGADAFRFEVLRDLSDVPVAELAARLNAAEIEALRTFPETYNLMEAGVSGTVAGAETRAIWSKQRAAMWSDPEYRARTVATMRERAADPEHQERRVEALKEALATPAQKKRLSKQAAAIWSDPEHRSKHSARNRANWEDPDYRERQAASRRASWQDPQMRANRIAGLLKSHARRKAANDSSTGDG